MRGVRFGRTMFGRMLVMPVLFVVLAGCGGGGPPKAKVFHVGGKVTGGSGDLTGYTIIFHPVDPSLPSASGTIKAGGAYELEAIDGRRGCAAGQYKITLEMSKEAVKEAMMKSMKPGASGPPPALAGGAFPEKYSSIETSDKVVEVKEEVNTIDIQL